MTNAIKIGVSHDAYAYLTKSISTDVVLVPVDEHQDSISILWRRQCDRTKWVHESLENLPGLRWLHTDTAGVDRLPLELLEKRGVILSNAGDAHSPAVSEWALGAMFLAAKTMHQTVRDSDSHVWLPRYNNLQMHGSKVVILGLGSIGATLAAACAAIGMEVVGVSRSGVIRPGVSRTVRANEDWIEELTTASFLVNCLPLTSETRNIVGEKVFTALPEKAWIINVGRGETIEEQHLVSALRSGHIGGAILDTVVEEPLSRNSMLWDCPNVIVSPHMSGFTDQTELRTRKMFIEELHRYQNGQPPINLVNTNKGY